MSVLLCAGVLDQLRSSRPPRVALFRDIPGRETKRIRCCVVYSSGECARDLCTKDLDGLLLRWPSLRLEFCCSFRAVSERHRSKSSSHQPPNSPQHLKSASRESQNRRRSQLRSAPVPSCSTPGKAT